MTSGWNYNGYSDRYFLTYAFEQLVINRSPRLSAIIYTQLSDIENESNGIMTYDRKEIKFVSNHINRVLKSNLSGLYKLQYIWKLSSTPYTNYTYLSLSAAFRIKSTPSFYRLYFYTCYLYSFVNITVDKKYIINLDKAHKIRNYHYISLPNHLYHYNSDQAYLLDINIYYEPSFYNDGDETFPYTSKTYFDLSIVMLSE